nr:PREDICTED: lectin-like [Latimeria chalumnae]|eukprot:XP_014353954.1 PREDICTED: lectin-like [Latimeria chalumnae]
MKTSAVLVLILGFMFIQKSSAGGQKSVLHLSGSSPESHSSEDPASDPTSNPALQEFCQGSCVDRWVSFDDRCFQFVAKPMDWMSAEAFCQRLVKGAHLVSVHSQEQNDFLVKLVRANMNSTPRTWIGANDRGTVSSAV